MFCIKCGTPTNNDQQLCDDCKNVPLTHDTMLSPSKSRCKVRLSRYVALAMSISSTLLAIFSIVLLDVRLKYFSIATAVIALCLGIFSIVHFIRCLHAGHNLPIATLVLGIIGIVICIIYIILTPYAFQPDYTSNPALDNWNQFSEYYELLTGN